MTKHPGVAPASHQTAYDRAVKLDEDRGVQGVQPRRREPNDLRDAYGRNLFGQGCLLARRLVERGVPFVEVTLAGVDNNGASAGTRTQTISTRSSNSATCSTRPGPR